MTVTLVGASGDTLLSGRHRQWEFFPKRVLMIESGRTALEPGRTRWSCRAPSIRTASLRRSSHATGSSCGPGARFCGASGDPAWVARDPRRAAGPGSTRFLRPAQSRPPGALSPGSCWDGPPPEAARTHLDTVAERVARGELWEWHLFADGVLCGAVRLKDVEPPNRKAAVAYYLGAEFLGRGIATDAVRAVMRHAFDRLGLRRIELRCVVGNRPSIRLAERLGFVREGELRESEWLGDTFVNEYIYGLLRSEFRAETSKDPATVLRQNLVLGHRQSPVATKPPHEDGCVLSPCALSAASRARAAACTDSAASRPLGTGSRRARASSSA